MTGRHVSFAPETTLRSPVTFGQATLAARSGFFIEMQYLALGAFSSHMERIKIRSDNGGHSAPESVLRAIREMGSITVYDNSATGAPPRVGLQAEGRLPAHVARNRRHPLT